MTFVTAARPTHATHGLQTCTEITRGAEDTAFSLEATWQV